MSANKLTPLEMIKLSLSSHDIATLFVNKIDVNTEENRSLIIGWMAQRFKEFPSEFINEAEDRLGCFEFVSSKGKLWAISVSPNNAGEKIEAEDLAQIIVSEMERDEIVELTTEIVEKYCTYSPDCILGYIDSLFNYKQPTHAEICTYSTKYGIPIKHLHEATTISKELCAVIKHVVSNLQPQVFPQENLKLQ